MISVAVVGLAAAVLWIGAGRNKGRTTRDAGPLRVDSALLSFGAAWNQKDFQWTLPIENVTDRAIEVTRVEGSCYCTRVEPSAFPIGPGETVDVRLTLDLTVQDLNRASLPVRDHAEKVAAFTEDDAVRPAAVWEVRGRVRSGFSMVPGQLDFGDSLVAGSPFASKTVKVNCHEACQRLEVESDESRASALVTQTDGDGGGVGRQFEIHVVPNAGLPAGNHEFTLGVKAVLGDGETTAAAPLKVAARVLPEFGIVPSLTHLGRMTVGTEAEETVSLISRSGRSFSVERVESDSDDVSVEPYPVTAGGSRLYRLTIRASQTGNQQAEVRFHVRVDEDDSRASEPLILPVQYRYHGATPSG